MTPKIKVAIADDHPMIIDGLKSILSESENLVLTNAFSNGDELLKGLLDNQPDVLLLDIQMPGKGGDAILPSIVKLYPNLKVLTLTNFDSTLYVNHMMQHGAKGYLLKTTDKQILIKAIETVFEGKDFIDESLRLKLDQAQQFKRKTTSKIALTGREKEILQFIVNGNTNPEIASQIHLSVHTIENYRDSILLKMDVKNTAALVKKALQLGLAY